MLPRTIDPRHMTLHVMTSCYWYHGPRICRIVVVVTSGTHAWSAMLAPLNYPSYTWCTPYQAVETSSVNSCTSLIRWQEVWVPPVPRANARQCSFSTGLHHGLAVEQTRVEKMHHITSSSGPILQPTFWLLAHK